MKSFFAKLFGCGVSKKEKKENKGKKTAVTESVVQGPVYGPMTKKEADTLACRMAAFGNVDSASANASNMANMSPEERNKFLPTHDDNKWGAPDVWLSGPSKK
jgi:hypothetical protein